MKTVYAIVYKGWDDGWIVHICATKEVADTLMIEYNYDPYHYVIEMWPVDE